MLAAQQLTLPLSPVSGPTSSDNIWGRENFLMMRIFSGIRCYKSQKGDKTKGHFNFNTGFLCWFIPWRSAHLSTTMRLPFWDIQKYKRPCLKMRERDSLQTSSRHSWVRTVTMSCPCQTRPSGLTCWQLSMPYKAKSQWQLNLSTKSSKWERILASGMMDWSQHTWGFSNKPHPQHLLPAFWAYCETVMISSE